MDKLERFKGCMLGGATGDALGYVIEFDSLNAIRRKYGPHGLRTILKSKKDGNKAVISDDTQLTLFTADGLLWAAEDGVDSVDRVFRSYMRWYYTQTERIVKPEQTDWMKQQPHESKWGYTRTSIDRHRRRVLLWCRLHARKAAHSGGRTPKAPPHHGSVRGSHRHVGGSPQPLWPPTGHCLHPRYGQ